MVEPEKVGNRLWLYFFCQLSLIRIIIGFVQLFNCAVLCNVIIIGLKKDEPATGIRYYLMRLVCWWTSVVVVACMGGVPWVSVSYPDVCYKKYLGEDWVADYDSKSCGSRLSNHTTF